MPDDVPSLPVPFLSLFDPRIPFIVPIAPLSSGTFSFSSEGSWNFLSKFRWNKKRGNRGGEVSSCMSHALKISFTRRDARRRENKNACPGPGALNRWLRFTKERTNPRFATAKEGDLSAISRMHRWIGGGGRSDFDY